MEVSDLLFGIITGVGLSAASGFRVFLPLLAVSAAANFNIIDLSESFSWMDTWLAFGCFLTASIVEVLVYYIPAVDNLVDTIAGPAAVVAGTVLTASTLGDISPFFKWTLAIIAGGGAAGITQAATTVARGASTAMTGGLGNIGVSTIENGSSTGMALAAIGAVFSPPLMIALGVITFLVLAGGIWLIVWGVKKIRGRKSNV
ncbi:DUF4126 domain-containing protein [Limibacter armeniacum]|uniref:DUF4126 domain-containing protein n=1 Tax=Limibacter armeniacum TaxID=466084 RepID=UPI002FE5E79E